MPFLGNSVNLLADNANYYRRNLRCFSVTLAASHYVCPVEKRLTEPECLPDMRLFCWQREQKIYRKSAVSIKLQIEVVFTNTNCYFYIKFILLELATLVSFSSPDPKAKVEIYSYSNYFLSSGVHLYFHMPFPPKPMGQFYQIPNGAL